MPINHKIWGPRAIFNQWDWYIQCTGCTSPVALSERPGEEWTCHFRLTPRKMRRWQSGSSSVIRSRFSVGQDERWISSDVDAQQTPYSRRVSRLELFQTKTKKSSKRTGPLTMMHDGQDSRSWASLKNSYKIRVSTMFFFHKYFFLNV